MKTQTPTVSSPAIPRLAILDRDGTLNFASKDPASPLYYILKPENLILRSGAKEACQLLQAHGVIMVLATRQACVGRGLITRDSVGAINDRLEEMLGCRFAAHYVETTAPDKQRLYEGILSDYPRLKAKEMAVFDDHYPTLELAEGFGFRAYDGAKLLASVCEALGVTS